MTTPFDPHNEQTTEAASDALLNAGLERYKATAGSTASEAEATSLWSAIATELDKPVPEWNEPCDDELLNAYIDNELIDTEPLEQRLANDAALSKQVGDLLDTHNALQRYAVRLEASTRIDLTQRVMAALADAPDEAVEAPTWPLAWLQVLSAAYDEQLSESDKVLYHWLVQQEPHAVEQAAYQFQEVSESLARLGASASLQQQLLSPSAITTLVDRALHEEEAVNLPAPSLDASEQKQAKQPTPTLATILPFPVKRYWATTAAAVIVGVVGLSWLSSQWLQTSDTPPELSASVASITGAERSSLPVENLGNAKKLPFETPDVSITPVSTDDSLSVPSDTTMTVEDYIWEMNQDVNHDDDVVLLFNIKST